MPDATAIPTSPMDPSLSGDEQFAQDFGITTLTGHEAAEQPSGEQPRDESGRFAKDGDTGAPVDEKATQEAADEATRAPGETKPADGKAEAAITETPAEEAATVASPEAAESVKKLVGDVKIIDADGEVPLDLLPSIKVTYKAGGEEVTQSVPELIRRAQSAVYNERLEHEVNDSRAKVRDLLETRAPKMAQDIVELRGALDEQIKFNLELLTSDETLLAARQKFAEYNSPDQRAARAEAEAAQLREQLKRGPAPAGPDPKVHTDFVANEMLPAIASLVQQGLGPAVSEDDAGAFGQEIFARLVTEIETLGLRVNGAIPPKDLPRAMQVFRERVAPWAMQRAERLKSTADKRRKDERAAIEKDLKAKTQSEKNDLARGKIPPRNGSTPSRTTTRGAPSEHRTAAQISEDIIADAVRGVASG